LESLSDGLGRNFDSLPFIFANVLKLVSGKNGSNNKVRLERRFAGGEDEQALKTSFFSNR
jgi:hypothetical protein